MELSKKKLEDLISAVDKIVAANSQQEPSLFDELSAPTDIAKILDVPIQWEYSKVFKQFFAQRQ